MKTQNRAMMLVAFAGLAAAPAIAAQIQGPSTLQTPYVIGSAPGVNVVSIASNGNGTSAPNETFLNFRTGLNDYRLVGIPDGMGAFQSAQDVLDGTFTLLVNHENGANTGIVRAHGNRGSFVSQWTVRKSDFAVIGAKDLISSVNLWNGSSYVNFSSSNPMPAYSQSVAFPNGWDPNNAVPNAGKDGIGRLCSADLAPVSAYQFGSLGTSERIFMSGEEIGASGRNFAHIATGPNAGTTWELPDMGDFSWENSVASPFAQQKTIVLSTDDSTPGQVYMYVGDKRSTGSEIELAGLSGGTTYGIAIAGTTTGSGGSIEDRTFGLGNAVDGASFTKPFSLVNLGAVGPLTGNQLETNSDAAGVTQFLRPEDIHWDPSNPNRAIFVTTDAFNENTRIWSMAFNDITNPTAGGNIDMLADGKVPSSVSGGYTSSTGATRFQMADNISISRFGQVLIQEDPGNQDYLARIWMYDIASDSMLEVAVSDAARFAPTTGTLGTRDEETSGIIDAWDIIGPGWWLINMQAHYGIPGELVEGGQLMSIFIPQTVPTPGAVSVLGLAGLVGLRRRR